MTETPKIIHQKEFSPQVIQEATVEARTLFLKFAVDRVNRYSIIPITTKRLTKKYAPIAATERTIVVPLHTSSEIPLAFKASIQIYKGFEFEEINGQKLIRGYGNINDGYFLTERIDNNFRVLNEMNLDVVIPPQTWITPLPECWQEDAKRNSYSLLLVPDLTNRGKAKLIDLEKIDLQKPKNRELSEKIDEIKQKFESLDWKGCRHPGRTREETLDKIVKHMLFVLEENEKRELVIGDIDHFTFAS